MTVPGNLSSPLLATAAGAAAAYQIDRSLRFNPGDSAYLNRTPSSAGNRQSWTWSGWVKRSSLSGSARQVLFGGYGASTQTDEFQFGFGGQYETQDTIYWTQSSSSAATSSVYRDLSAWYHIVVSYDGSNIKIYVNGGLILTSAKTGDLGINGAWSHAVGADPNTNARLFNGYLAEVHFIDGQALAASDFGEYDDNNVWQPKEYSGTYGTNGFYLSFSDNTSTTTIAEDSSGNNNDFTAHNISVTAGSGNDSLIDTPTNYTAASGNNGGCYATWNPLIGTPSELLTFSNGNLECAATANSGQSHRMATQSTIGISSGKYYWEYSSMVNSLPGLAIDFSVANSYVPGETIIYNYNGTWYNQGSATAPSNGASWTSSDVIGVALNMDDKELTFYKNGVSQGTWTGLVDKKYFAARYQDSSGSDSSSIINFGQRPFSYTPPTGYVSLCTTNLPDPTIADGSTAMDAKLYTGTGSALTISNYDFSPDLAWIKCRNATFGHNLVDTVRGANLTLFSNTTGAESTQTDRLTAFTSDGFTLGTNAAINTSSNTHVAWAWDAGANSSKTYTVTVVSDSGNKYRFDGHGTSAVTLDLEEGSTYVFDQSDSSNSGHPLRFSTTSDGTHGSGTEYTTGVTSTGTPGSAGAKTTIVVASGAPTLYYYCSAHSGMGGQANTNSTAGASNFDGSIQSTCRANQTAGFSIVSWTASGTNNDSVGHGLNAKPEFFILKSRDGARNWLAYTEQIDGSLDFLNLNSTAAKSNSSATAPTSSVFYVYGSDVNTSGEDVIAYCFAPVEGYSAFGSYTGNGSADGPFVFTGFRPALIMVKRTDSTGNWVMMDSSRDEYNYSRSYLEANTSDTEGTFAGNGFSLLSNGFKLEQTTNSTNASSGDYIYMAWAENPFSSNGGLAR